MPTPLDNMSDDEIRALLQQVQAQPPQPPGAVEDIARTALPAVARGAAGIFGLPGALKGMADRALDATVGRYIANPLYNAATGRGLRLNTPEEDQGQQAALAPGRAVTQALSPQGIVGGVERVTGPLYHPQTMPGRLANSAIEWGAGSALGPLNRVPAMVGIGAAGGAASQGTDEIARAAGLPPDSWQRTILPSVVGIGTSMGAAALRPAPSDVLQRSLNLPGEAEFVREMRRGGMDEAAVRQAWAAEQSRQAQVITEARTRMQGGVEAGVPLSPVEALGDAGGQAQQLAGNVATTPQGARLRTALNARQDQVTGAVRGPGGFLEGVSPDVTPAIPARARTDATQQLYRDADMEMIPAAAVDPIVAETAAAGARTGLPGIAGYSADLGAAARTGNQYQLGPLSTLYQETRDRFALPPVNPNTVSTRTRGELGDINSRLVTALEEASPGFREAQTRFREMSPRVDAATIRERFNTLYEEALQGGSQTLPTNPTVGANFAMTTRGRRGGDMAVQFEEDIRTAARARGMNEDAAAQAAHRLMDTLEQTGRIPGVGSMTQPRQALARDAGNNWVSTLMELPADIMGRGAISRGARGMAERSTYRRLSGAMMPGGPEQLDRLLTLGGQGQASPMVGRVVRALTAAGGAR